MWSHLLCLCMCCMCFACLLFLIFGIYKRSQQRVWFPEISATYLINGFHEINACFVSAHWWTFSTPAAGQEFASPVVERWLRRGLRGRGRKWQINKRMEVLGWLSLMCFPQSHFMDFTLFWLKQNKNMDIHTYMHACIHTFITLHYITIHYTLHYVTLH